MIRLPVVYKGQQLMPMKSSRVRRLVRDKKAKIKFNRKIRMHYVQLLVDPSGTDVQEITLGIDPGAVFDGFSVVSKTCHHLNIELIQRPKKGKVSIKYLKERQAGTRMDRRSRLRHRPIRFSNRIAKKLAPTIMANVEFRQWLILQLRRYFPISKVVIEDVKFNHFKSKSGRSFSHVELGKTALYDFIKNLGLELELYAGYNTKKLRMGAFGGVDNKTHDKREKSFNAHCLDSFVLACSKSVNVDDQPVITNVLEVNQKVSFIEKIVKVRRQLTRTRKYYTTKHNKIGPQYYRRLKGGIKQIYQNFSSHRQLCRIKPHEEHSNHPKEWIYLDFGFAERLKHNEAPYGGTVFNGVKKFFINNEWINRSITAI